EPTGEGRFATSDGGEQLRLVPAPRRRLVELGVGADDPDDLARVASGLGRLGVAVERSTGTVVAVDPGTGVRVVVGVAERLRQTAVAAAAANGPGRVDRPTGRAAGILREGPVRPR